MQSLVLFYSWTEASRGFLPGTDLLKILFQTVGKRLCTGEYNGD